MKSPPDPLNHVPPRIVLDTNVCLDLFVFGDPRVATLRAALQAGDVVAVTDAECRGEWLRVLDYPALRLDETARAGAIAAFDAHVQLVSADPLPQVAVPRCADPDDQKFLHLAHACGARWLLSRDDALLVLARRTRRDGLFEILMPDAWAP
ncbi:PIN domain-containing protein [Lysobacter sp. S4-A87]|uniref:PIN domain-containing protein n=1 Tax=Lysobacter sp. S4-A87 TaxID=2925843 RepID=UPI001F53BEED|nr:PIN domain-containing protein [Lysobacter sp. S4-A87]UNK50678.1 PIN domain-containing protein [Lysobacter sp. S4-A87]